MRWFRDWRTQAFLCVLFVVFGVYYVLDLLSGGPGYEGFQVATSAILALSAGHTAVSERRIKVREQHKDDSPD